MIAADREKAREAVAGDVLGGPGEHHCIDNNGCTVCAGNRAVDALIALGWRPGGVPVAPPREALLAFLVPRVGPFADEWADWLLASGLLVERREDVQAEALEAMAARGRAYVSQFELHQARSAESRKAAQS